MNAPWPADPRGDMVPILEASVEAAKQRHPSANPVVHLNATDRCDACGAAAVYRVAKREKMLLLDFCGHHWRKHFATMAGDAWLTVATNPALVGTENRLQGSDH